MSNHARVCEDGGGYDQQRRRRSTKEPRETENDLKRLFEQFGKVFTVVKCPGWRHKSDFAFVGFCNEESQNRALNSEIRVGRYKINAHPARNSLIGYSPGISQVAGSFGKLGLACSDGAFVDVQQNLSSTYPLPNPSKLRWNIFPTTEQGPKYGGTTCHHKCAYYSEISCPNDPTFNNLYDWFGLYETGVFRPICAASNDTTLAEEGVDRQRTDGSRQGCNRSSSNARHGNGRQRVVGHIDNRSCDNSDGSDDVTRDYKESGHGSSATLAPSEDNAMDASYQVVFEHFVKSASNTSATDAPASNGRHLNKTERHARPLDPTPGVRPSSTINIMRSRTKVVDLPRPSRVEESPVITQANSSVVPRPDGPKPGLPPTKSFSTPMQNSPPPISRSSETLPALNNGARGDPVKISVWGDGTDPKRDYVKTPRRVSGSVRDVHIGTAKDALTLNIPPLPKLHPLKPRPNSSMDNIIVCFSGYMIKDQLARMTDLVHRMGGSVRKDFSAEVTHLVANRANGEKYRAAVSLGIHVMSEEWIHRCWESRDNVNVSAADEHLMQFKLNPFSSLLLSFIGFSKEETRQMERITISNGGTILDAGSPSTTHFVVNEHVIRSISFKFSSKSHVVKSEWFWASVQIDACADESMYLVGDSEATPNSHEDTKTPKALFGGSGTNKRKRLQENWAQLAMDGETDPPFYKRRSLGAGRESLGASVLDATYAPLAEVTVHENPVCSPVPMPRSQKEVKLTGRQQSIKELFQTETNYVGILQTIIKVFKEGIEHSGQPGGPILDVQDVRAIFGGIPPICNLHVKIRDLLGEITSRWSDDLSVGSVFLRHTDELMKLYSNFIKCFENTEKTVILCDRSKPRFHAFLRLCQTKPECGRQTQLMQLLIRPIQRLPSIMLLMEDILKRTELSHPDHQPLEEAIRMLQEVVTLGKRVSHVSSLNRTSSLIKHDISSVTAMPLESSVLSLPPPSTPNNMGAYACPAAADSCMSDSEEKEKYSDMVNLLSIGTPATQGGRETLAKIPEPCATARPEDVTVPHHIKRQSTKTYPSTVTRDSSSFGDHLA